MLKLDHLAIIAPSLEVGAEHVYEQLGISIPVGGKHREMGTHNLLLGIGSDVFLEVIAVDPGANQPKRARWFGLDDTPGLLSAWADGRRLRGWVTRTNNFDETLAQHHEILGRKELVSRGDRSWAFGVPEDGSLPFGGLVPSVMDWGSRGSPAPSLPDLGARLVSFQLEHPNPGDIRKLYRTLNIVDPPEVVEGSQVRYSAKIRTPTGLKTLT